MDMQIKGHNIKVSEELRARVEDTLGHLDTFEADIVNIEVFLTVEKERHKASATVNLPQHKSIHADVTTNDMYEAIDKLYDKLKIVIREHRTEQIDERNRGTYHRD